MKVDAGGWMRWVRGLVGWAAIGATASGIGVVAAAPMARPVEPQAPLHRIVSLIPAVTEMLFAMDAGNEVVGVSTFDHYPPAVETRTRVGALVDPDFERIISLRPDLVVVYATQSDLIARLDRAHLPIFKYQHAGLADVTATMRTLGTRIGRAREAEREATRVEHELDAVRASTAGRPRPRTALVFGREAGALRGIFVSGGVGFLHDMLEVAGGTNVFGDVRQQSLQASAELLIARAPEVILELRPDEKWSDDRLRQETAVWKGLPTLPAVRSGRVYILADDRLLVPGPRVAEAVRMMAGAVRGTGLFSTDPAERGTGVGKD
jgi:iron complex transport system substrate-binding protein